MNWDREIIFFITLNESTYKKVETNHHSANLILGCFSTVLQLLFLVSLLAQGWLKGRDNGNMKMGRVSLLFFFPLPNGTPRPSFIG
jgi:hypothetical protein